MELELRAFGSLEVRRGGLAVRLASRPRQVLLAVLLLHRGQAVSTGTLISSMWPVRTPAATGENLRIHIHRLRRALGDRGAIQHRRPGYALEVPPDRVDVHRFEQLCQRGHAALAAGDEAAAAELLERALGWCRGPAFQGLEDVPALAIEADRLRELQLAALEGRATAELALGRHAGLVAELTALVAEHPLRERFRVLLMAALYHCGRRADALAVFREGRQLLVRELGIEPGPECRELERAILADDPARVPPGYRLYREHPAGWSLPVPRQLPSDLAGFTGRAAELRELDQLLPEPATGVVSIEGPAGIGKTTLAVHAAHRLVDRFPDGQLFIDLCGFTQGVAPVAPAEALERLLRDLGIPATQIPAGLDARAALYRSRLADRRVLIVLDNAATEAQVTPLLPGSAGCVALVTSRRRLAGLDHTGTLSLDILPVPDAVTLLARTAGERRLADQPAESVVELVELCGRLPLAIQIAGARLRSHPAWLVSHLVERLRDQRHRLGELEAGQRSVTAALDVSYQHLSADQQEAYRLLGLHPGPDLDTYATAALLECTLTRAGRVLDRLLEAHLLLEPAPGRYRFHDLTRAHAARTATAVPGASTPEAALGRLLDYYRHTAAAAMDAAYPYERDHRPPVPPVPDPGRVLSDPAAALAWLDSELPNLLAAARYAAGHGRPAHLLHLSTILHRHLRTRGRYCDAEDLHQQARDAARAAGDQAGALAAAYGLGEIHRLQGRPGPAADHFEEALRIARATGDRTGELAALNGLGSVGRLRGRYAHATDQYQQALRIARATGDRTGELTALNGLGWIHQRQGRYEPAAAYLEEGLGIARATGHRPGEQDALGGLGNVRRMQGRHAQAADHYQQGLRLARATGNRTGELNALNGLGHIRRMQSRYAQAADHYEQALRIARATGNYNGQLNALLGLGHIHRVQGRYEQASGYFRRLLALALKGGDRNWQFEAWQGLGRLRHATGDPDVAIAFHKQALILANELGQPGDQARAHDGLARAHHHPLNQHDRARQHWQQALNLLTHVGIDRTEDEEATIATIRAHLSALTQR